MQAHIISTIALTLGALSVFFYIGYRVRDLVQSDDEFLFAGRHIGTEKLAYTWSVSTIAYASGILYYMQVVPLWGYWVFVGSIGFYALGQIAALYIATRPHIDFTSFTNLGSLAARETNSQWIGRLVSFFNFLAALSLVYIEIGLGVELFGFLVPNAADEFKLAMVVVLALVVFLYLSFGGFRAVIESDAWQGWLVFAAGLAIAYVAFSLAQANIEAGRPIAVFKPSVPLSPDILIYLAFAFSVNAVFNIGQLSIWQRIAATESTRERIVGGSIGIGSSVLLYSVFIVAAGIYAAAGYGVSAPADIFAPIGELGAIGNQLIFPILFVGLVAALISSADTAAISATLAVFGGRSTDTSWPKRRRTLVVFIFVMLTAVVGAYAWNELYGVGYQAVFLAVIFYMYSQLVVAAPVVATAILAKRRLRQPKVLVVGLVAAWLVLTVGTLTSLFGSGLNGNLVSTVLALLICTSMTVRFVPKNVES